MRTLGISRGAIVTSLAAMLALPGAAVAGASEAENLAIPPDPTASVEVFDSFVSEVEVEADQSISGRNDAFVVSITNSRQGAHFSLVQIGPVSESSDELTLDNGQEIDMTSMVNLTHDQSASNWAPNKVSGCRTLPNQNGWVRRADCLVYDSTRGVAVISGQFTADYSVKSGGGRVDLVYGAHAQCGTVGPVTSQNLEIVRPQNVGTVPARAMHEFKCGVGGLGWYARHDLLAYGSAWSEVIA